MRYCPSYQRMGQFDGQTVWNRCHVHGHAWLLAHDGAVWEEHLMSTTNGSDETPKGGSFRDRLADVGDRIDRLASSPEAQEARQRIARAADELEERLREAQLAEKVEQGVREVSQRVSQLAQ